MKARDLIRDIPDFPQPGILFRDITPVLLDPEAFGGCLDAFVEDARAREAELILGIESRGFLFGAPTADRVRLGFGLIRKAGKLPGPTARVDYDLEYGTSSVEIHLDAIQPNQRCLIVDDVLATGGTAAAACRLVEQVGGQVAGLSFLIELTELGGRALLAERPVTAMIQY